MYSHGVQLIEMVTTASNCSFLYTGWSLKIEQLISSLYDIIKNDLLKIEILKFVQIMFSVFFIVNYSYF